MPNNGWLINNAMQFQFWPQSESLLPGLRDEFGPLLLVARITDWFKLELMERNGSRQVRLLWGDSV